jgi:cytochrome c
MKRVMTATLLATCLVAPAMASKELAQAKNCLACHSLENQVVGPAFKAIAAKYAGDKAAAASLATKIMAGGGGVWGAIPMPANPQVKEDEAKKLVAWILSLK